MSDEVPPVTPDPPTPDEAETEAAASAVDDGKGNRMVPLGTLVDAKKALQAAKRRIGELEPVAAQAASINERLNKAQPIIDAVITNPKLRAEAIRIVQGSRPSGEATAQPVEDDDARGYAEDMGFYLADGVTPDAARGRRVLDRLAKTNQAAINEAIRPLAGTVLNSRAEQNVREIAAMTDANGVPYATEEGIREVMQMLGTDGASLVANPQVAQVVLRSAIGADRIAGRSPKAPEEPLYLDRQGGSRRTPEPSLSSDEKRMIERLGLTEKEYTESSKRLEDAVAHRRGVVMGVK